MKFDVLVDLQFGSTGKGLLAGYLGVKNGYEAVISANNPNAGHSAYAPDSGKLFVHKVLPSAIFGTGLRVIGVAPGAIFDPDRLEKEWKEVCEYRHDLLLVIHESAAVLTDEHRDKELRLLNHISSTMQGSAAAMVDKIMRKKNVIVKDMAEPLVARLVKYGSTFVANQREWIDIFNTGGDVLLEGAQGYSLGINAGFYPYCTSRDCTPARVIADCSLPVAALSRIYGCARVHPIRVGNTPDGYSGDWYPDQREISFGALNVEPERTTVTKRVRRIATFSAVQIREAMQMAMPDEIFLNFCQYDYDSTDRAIKAINSIAKEVKCGGVQYTGWGPLPADISEVE